MASQEQDLARALIDELEARGIPHGSWLVEIAQVRQALQSADALLRRMADAIVRTAQAGVH